MLIDELRARVVDTSVTTIKGSSATFHIGEDCFQLGASQCEKVLHSPATVQALYEALEEKADIRVELHDLTVDEDVEAALEETFAAVEEV